MLENGCILSFSFFTTLCSHKIMKHLVNGHFPKKEVAIQKNFELIVASRKLPSAQHKAPLIRGITGYRRIIMDQYLVPRKATKELSNVRLFPDIVHCFCIIYNNWWSSPFLYAY